MEDYTTIEELNNDVEMLTAEVEDLKDVNYNYRQLNNSERRENANLKSWRFYLLCGLGVSNGFWIFVSVLLGFLLLR